MTRVVWGGFIIAAIVIGALATVWLRSSDVVRYWIAGVIGGGAILGALGKVAMEAFLKDAQEHWHDGVNP